MPDYKHIEIIIDTNKVTVSAERYDELVTKEAQLQSLKNMYYNNEIESFNYDTVFGAIFGKRSGEKS